MLFRTCPISGFSLALIDEPLSELNSSANASTVPSASVTWIHSSRASKSYSVCCGKTSYKTMSASDIQLAVQRTKEASLRISSSSMATYASIHLCRKTISVRLPRSASENIMTNVRTSFGEDRATKAKLVNFSTTCFDVALRSTFRADRSAIMVLGNE